MPAPAEQRSAKAVGYMRLSPGERAAGGLGLEAQRTAIVAAAGRLGLAIAGVHVDNKKSGGKGIAQRPGLAAAIAELGEGDVLLVAKSDRLSRGDVLQGAVIEQLVHERGATVVSASGEGTEDDSPESRLMRRILGAFAEFERYKIAERTAAALAVKRTRRERTGSLPFGKREVEGKLVDDVVERRAIALMKKLRAAGLSLASICAKLDAARVKTRRGGAWKPETVRKIIAAA